jgi:O-antigen/teichoic acid export membrane protein
MAQKENSIDSKRGSTQLALKAGFWYVASTFLLRSVAFITTPIFSRLMSKSDYGEFSNYASWQSTILILTGAELYNTLSRAYYDYKDDYDQYISSVTIVNCILTCVFYLLFLAGRSWIFRIVAIPEQYIHILFFTLLCTSCKTIFLTRERTLYRYKSVAAISAVDMLIPTGISVLLVFLANESDRLSARIYGFYLPSAAVGLICAIVLISKGRSFRVSHCRYAFKLALPLLVHYLTVYLLTSTNTIITKSIKGAEIAAIVSISTSVIHILTILFQSLSGAVTTWLMDNLEQRNYEKIRRETLVYLAMLSVVSAGVIFLAPEGVWILGGAKYAEATPLIPGLILSVFIQAVSTVFTIILTFDKNVTKTAIFTGIVAVLSVAGKIWLLPIMGIQCLPLVNIAAYVILFAVNYLLVRQAGYGAAIHLKGYLLFLLGIGAITAASSFLYRNTMIRYGIILLLGCAVLWAAYRKRNLIIDFLKKRREKKS